MQKLSGHCVSLQRDTTRAREESEMERNLKEQLQQQIQKMNANEGKYVVNLEGK